MPKQKRHTTEGILSGKTWHLSSKDYAEHNDGFKGDRPGYILKTIEVDTSKVLVIKSTMSRTDSTKSLKKYISYTNPEGGTSWLRLDLKNGFEIVDKKEIQGNKKNLSDGIVISKKDREKLLHFYRGHLYLNN